MCDDTNLELHEIKGQIQAMVLQGQVEGHRMDDMRIKLMEYSTVDKQFSEHLAKIDSDLEIVKKFGNDINDIRLKSDKQALSLDPIKAQFDTLKDRSAEMQSAIDSLVMSEIKHQMVLNDHKDQVSKQLSDRSNSDNELREDLHDLGEAIKSVAAQCRDNQDTIQRVHATCNMLADVSAQLGSDQSNSLQRFDQMLNTLSLNNEQFKKNVAQDLNTLLDKRDNAYIAKFADLSASIASYATSPSLGRLDELEGSQSLLNRKLDNLERQFDTVLRKLDSLQVTIKGLQLDRQ